VQLDDVGGMDQPVADRVGDRGFTDQVMPALDRHLAGDERGGALATILEDLEQILPLDARERGEAPIVDLCGAPHNSTYGEHSVMWGAAAPLKKSLGFPQS